MMSNLSAMMSMGSDILNDMVKAVYVHAPVIEDGEKIQDVDISYNLIGILPYSLLKNLQNRETA